MVATGRIAFAAQFDRCRTMNVGDDVTCATMTI